MTKSTTLIRRILILALKRFPPGRRNHDVRAHVMDRLKETREERRTGETGAGDGCVEAAERNRKLQA